LEQIMGTVTKALSLLNLFTRNRPEIGLSDITRLCGMNKATVYRMLGELQAQGFVEQVGNDRAYRLGPEVLRLAALREAAVPLLSVSREVLARLCEVTGETAHMSQVQGDRLNTFSYAYGTRHATQVMMEDAEVLSFHATGSGLAILGFAPSDFVDRILSQPLTVHTSDTQTNPVHIRAALETVRRTGVAESIGGFEAEVHSHAAPIFGANQVPIGALAVAVPVSRMTPALATLIRSELMDCAQDLTQRIGGFPPPSYPQQVAA
jgi:DNA-binding IclR family transcriptional regulator